MFYTYAHYKPDNSVFYIGKGQGRRAFDKISRSKKLSESVKMSWIARRLNAINKGNTQ